MTREELLANSAANIKKLQEIRKLNPRCIITVCYDDAFVHKTKAEAARFYRTGMMCSEGAERDRYTNVYCKIMDGYKTANDSDDWDGNQLKYVRDLRIKEGINLPTTA